MNYDTENFYRKRLVKSRKEVAKLHKIILIMSCFMVFMIGLGIFGLKQYTDTALQLKETTDSYNEVLAAYDELYDTYEGMHSEYVDMVNYTSECETTINGLNEVITALDEQSKSLAQSNEEYYERIQQYEEREELFDKYEYAIIRTDGTRTDITYDQLIDLEELSAEKNVDTDLVLAIAMVESSGTEKACSTVSTARGYGQFIYSTAEFVYEDLMNEGSYKHEYALDGDTNLAMMVNYISYLEDIYDGDLYSSIRNYRGRGGSVLNNYIGKIDSYLEAKGKSVSYINSMS